jgi:murein DD-endopeptidase MepM/ murein hydrolase activator NlpD
MVDRRTRSRKKSTVLTLDGRPPPRRGTLRLLLVLGVMVLVNLYVFVWKDGTSIRAVKARAADLGTAPLDQPPAPAPAVEQPTSPQAAPRGVIEGKVEKNESLGKILRSRLRLEPAAADELIRAVGPVFDLRGLRPGQAFRLEVDDEGQVESFELTVSRTVTVRIVRDPATGQLAGTKDQQATRIEVREVGGKVDSSLYAAIKAAGEDGSLVGFFVDVFAYDLDFYNDTHDGDEFRVVVEKEYVGAEFLRYRRILAAEYAGKAGTFRAFYWAPPGADKGRYFDELGQSVERSMLKTPLKFARVSSGFNPRRMHPVLHRVKGHFGTDFACPVGTPVWAAADGVVSQAGWAGGAGNMITIRHDNGLTTLYMHLSKIGKGTKVGQRVAAKTVIGYSGNTGLSTGPHLHFGVKKNGAYVDFQTLKPSRAGGVPKKELAAFKAGVKGLVARLAAVSTAPAPTPTPDPVTPSVAANPPS